MGAADKNDPFDLQRFVDAQDAGETYAHAVAELRRGRKTSHWMWFVFPQLEGLGHSAMAKRYAISSLDEAVAYLAHPVLGARLRECVGILNATARGATAEAILGAIDAQKLRSSLTLFLRAAREDADEEALTKALDRYFGGVRDEATDALLV